MLNDNTYDNAYNIPSEDQLINRIQDANQFSKFDCKLGYHQIKMHKESVDWITFICINPIGGMANNDIWAPKKNVKHI